MVTRISNVSVVIRRGDSDKLPGVRRLPEPPTPSSPSKSRELSHEPENTAEKEMDNRGKTSSPSSKEDKTTADNKEKSTLQSCKRSLSQASAEKSSPSPLEKSPPAPLGSAERGRRGRPPLAASKDSKEGRRSQSEGQEAGVVTTALVEVGGSRLVAFYVKLYTLLQVLWLFINTLF